MNTTITTTGAGLRSICSEPWNPWNPSTTYITNPSTNLYINTNMNKPTQNRVAVFKVTRNDENEIISTEFLKEMWVETKNGKSVDFEVARDKDLAKYNAEDLSIRVIYSVIF